MPRRHARTRLSLVAAASLAAAAGGCSGVPSMSELANESTFTLNKPVITAPSWATRSRQTAQLGPSGPVAPEDLVAADGSCAPEAAPEAPAAAQASAQAAAPAPQPAEPATPPAQAAYGSLAGDLAGAPMPQGPTPAPAPRAPTRVASAAPDAGLGGLQPEGSFGGFGTGSPVLGGISLGMTECQAVRRAGRPSSVNIGAGDNGARKVVVTYLSGPWPGIYTFESGRLKVVDAAPVQQKPAAPKNKRRARTRAAAR